MATLPIDDGFISVREYLRTSYSHDCEYVDGRIVERNSGDKGHSILQMFLAGLFWVNRAAWGVRTRVFERISWISSILFAILEINRNSDRSRHQRRSDCDADSCCVARLKRPGLTHEQC